MPGPTHQSFLSFNAGEISPYLNYRTDFAKHASGVATMENFLPMPFGGFRKRPGTLYLATLSGACRLQTFYVSGGVAYSPPGAGAFTGQIDDEAEGSSYILAFSTTQIKVYQTDGTLAQTLSLATADPFKLQMAQVNNVMFIVGPDIVPQSLTFTLSTVTFALAETPFTYPPLLDENADETLTIATSFVNTIGTTWANGTVYSIGNVVKVAGVGSFECILGHTGNTANNKPNTGTAWTTFWEYADDSSSTIGQSVTLTASSALFASSHVGAIFKISKERPANLFETSIAATTANDGKWSNAIPIEGAWAFNTFGTWEGTFTLQRSFDHGITWEDFRKYAGEKNRNVADEGTQDVRAMMRVKWSYGATGSSSPKGVLSSSEPYISGLVKVTAYTSSTTVTATTVTPVEACTTEFWTEGAFSAFQGYPAAVGIHERRLVYGGTTKKQASIWTSKTDDLLNFKTGTDADSSIFVTLAGTRMDPIRWIASQRRLFIGTGGGEWVFGSETTDAPLSPSNLLAREYTRFGSTTLPALVHHDSIFFVERQGRRLREMAYQIQNESYDAADLSRLAEHITTGGIVQLAWQQNREPYLWAVRSDGTLLSFNYNRDEQIAAWSRHTTYSGQFKSVAVIRNQSNDDSIFFVVKRGNSFILEKFASRQQAYQEGEGVVLSYHGVDCGSIGTFSTLALPAIHRGTTVTICRGYVAGTATCNAGTGLLTTTTAAASPYDVCHAGFPITATLTTLPLDVQADNGTTHFRRKRANEIVINVVSSAGGTVTYGGQDQTLTYGDKVQAWGTGILETTLPPAFLDDLTVTLTHAEPYPFLVRAIVLRWSLHEP
jgi:hypothetical protein